MTCWSNYSLIKFLSFWYWIQFLIIVNCYFNNISAIVVPPNSVKIIRIEDPKNRELLDVSKKKAESDPERLAPILSCLHSFINIALNRQPPKITVLVTRFVDLDMQHVYLSTIEENRTALVLSSDMDWENYAENAFEIVILLETPESVENISYDLINLGDDDCRYGVVLTQKFSNEESFMDVARFLIVKLWEKRIAHAAILGIIGKSMVAAKSTSFMPVENLHPSNPLLMDRCNSEKDWDESIDIFMSMDMNNCTVQVGYFSREPYIRVLNFFNSSQVTGLEALIFTIVAKKYNFRIIINELEWVNNTAEEDIIKKRLSSNGSIDLILGGILWAPVGHVDFTIPYDVVQVVWLIPMHSNISLRGLVTPLSTKVWFGVIAVIICTVVLRVFLFKEISLLEIVALVIGVGWPKQPERDSSRLQFISYVLFGFLLVQFYLASMAGQFMAQAGVQIETMGDLISSGLVYGGTKSHYLMFHSAEEATVEEEEEDQEEEEEEEEEETNVGVLERIAKNFVIFDQSIYSKLLRNLNTGENTSVALAVTMNVSSVGSKFDHHKVHILNEILSSYPLAFPLWKGLPYLDRVDDTIRRLTETGIMLYLGRLTSWEDGAIYHAYEDIQDDTNLRLADLAPGFLLLIIGYGLGLVSLVVEIAFKKLDTHLKNKQKIKDEKKLKKKKKLRIISNKNLQQNYVRKSKDRKNTVSWDVMDSQRVIVQQVIRPNVKIGYYKDMY